MSRHSGIAIIVLFVIIGFSNVAFSDVLGLAADSELPWLPDDQFENCVFSSLKNTKGQYVKPQAGFGPFNAPKTAKIADAQNLDAFYHFAAIPHDQKWKVRITRYTTALGKITGLYDFAQDRYDHPCDQAVFGALDRIGKEPTHLEKAEPVLNQARQLASLGRFDEAGQYFNQAASMVFRAGSIYREMGRYLQGAGRADWAAEWYRTAIKMDPLEVESFMLLARIESERGFDENAVIYLEQSLDRGALPPIIYTELGRLYKKLNRYEMAIDILEKALALDPENLTTLETLVWALEKDRRFADATKIHMKVIRYRPKDIESRTKLLDLYMKAENYHAAILILETYIKQAPNEPGWIQMLARAREGRQDYSGARVEYTRLLTLQPDNPQARVALARIAYRDKDFAGATVLLEQVLTAIPSHVEAMRLLSRVYEMQGNYEKAMKNHTRVILYSDGVSDADLQHLFALSKMAKANGRTVEAINQILPFKSRADQRRLIMAVAEAMVNDGKKERAADFLHSRMSFLQRYAPAYMMLGKLYLEKGQYDEADQVFRSAIFLTPDGSLPMSVATIYHRLKQFERAEFFYTFALNRDSENVKIRLRYTEVCLLSGNIEQALWLINEMEPAQMAPLYRLFFAYLQIMYASIKGDDAFFESAMSYGLSLIKVFGTTNRLDFSDFPPLIESRFEGQRREMLKEATLLFEGKINPDDFFKKFPQWKK